MQINAPELGSVRPPLPRGPVLDWSSFTCIDVPNVHSIENLPNVALTTSGRAAIYQALLQLKLPAHSTVLVPTYHCPTMVAPVLLAHLEVAYFGLRSDGLPHLEAIENTTAQKCSAILVPHYFGLAKSLREVRQWCDARGIALIEDCAHCYFGNAGERPVGAWGDFATASLSKFFPVPEAGLLASAYRPIAPLGLNQPSIKAQAKGWIDVVELASQYRRFAGLRTFFSWIFKLKNLRTAPSATCEATATPPDVSSMVRDCDMARIGLAPLWAAIALKNVLPRGYIITQRQKNFSRYAAHFAQVMGARPLFPITPGITDSTAPYVIPIWVDEPDAIYQAVRALKLPIFRWDRIWPHTPVLPDDNGPLWSHHVLQLLCHQDLSAADIDYTAQVVLGLLQTQQAKIHAIHE